MRLVYSGLCLLFVFGACSKKDTDVVTNITPVTAVRPQQNTLPASINAPEYPYTDTFSGYLQSYVYDGWGVPGQTPLFSAADASFIFYSTHFSPDSMVFHNPKGIQLDRYGNGPIITFGTATNAKNEYIYGIGHSRYLFKVVKDSLNITWDYDANCGEEEYTGSYYARSVPKRR